MRLAGQVKMGYFPAHPDAVRLIAGMLRLEDKKPDECNIIDPCAGRGDAIVQLAEALGVARDRTYAIELDADRAEECRSKGLKTLGPCGFLGARVTGYSFGLAYVNPPFDHEMGGGRREELAFTERATRLLVTKGVLVLVAPITAVNGNKDFCKFLDSRFEDIRLFQFPRHCQPYREIVVIGRRRKMDLPGEAIGQHGDLHKAEFHWRIYGWEDKITRLGAHQYTRLINGQRYGHEPMPTYEIPWAWRPNTFAKTAYTEPELELALESSPLNAMLREVPVPPPASPPLPLDKGHVALLLASGMLNGVVEDEFGTHVVRGTARKSEHISHAESTENVDTGAVTEKIVFSQRITLTIRAVDQAGVIHTFSDEAKDKGEAEDTHEGRYEEDAA